MKLDETTRIYIAGCGGMLGEAVYELFDSIGEVLATDIDVNEPWLSFGDVRDFDGIAPDIRSFRPDVIINLAALTDLEYCERHSDDAWKTNGLGAENLGLIANELDIPCIYISTAGIFDGAQEFYTEFDTPNPLSEYGRSKAYGEAWMLRTVRKPFVIRAGWMMGGGPGKDKKFINKIYKQIAAGARELAVVEDKLGTPTYTLDFARGIARLLESDLYGLYNQVCGGSGSRYDVAVAFVRELGLEDRVTVRKVSSDYFKTEYFAPRPPSEKLLNVKLEARGLSVMRDWEVCLAEYAQRFKERLEIERRELASTRMT